MARIKYQPSTRVKQFNPIQLSKEGITQMRRDSDRMIQGLQNNFQAEKEQQARDRAAMEENAALEEDRIKRDRQIELENLRNEQSALSQQARIDVQQDKFDAEAQNTFFETIVDFSKTAMAKAAENHANMIKDQTAEANARPIDHMVKDVVDRYQDVETNVQVAGGMRLDADAQENAVETGEQVSETLRAFIGNPGLGDVQNRVIQNRVLKGAFSQIMGRALSGTEAIYDNGAGNKFAGIQAQEDPALMGILSAQVERDLFSKMGINTAEPGRFVEGMTEIQKQKAALQNQANTKLINNSKVVLEQQAVDHASANTTQGYTIAFHKRKMLSLEKAHTGHQNLIGDPTTNLEALDRVDLMGNGKRYSETWPKRWEAGLVQRRANETKAIKATIAFRKAQQDQFELDNIDTIRAAFDQNPTQAFRAAQEQAHYQGLTVSARVKEIHTAAIADKKDQELSVLQTKIRAGSLDESYVNRIQNPTVRKQAMEELVREEERLYGAPLKQVKAGYVEMAQDMLGIEMGSSAKNSFRVVALANEMLKKHKERYAVNQDYNTTINSISQDRINAAAGTKNFLSTTELGGGRTQYEHEKSGEDRTNFNEDLDLIIAKYGSNVADYAFNIETTAETETTLLSAQGGNIPVFSKGLHYVRNKINAANPNVKPLGLAEMFNAMQQEKTRLTGKKYPLITSSLATDTVDAMDPATLKYYMKAKEFNSHMSALNANARFTGTVNNHVRGSMVQRTGMRGLADLVSSGEGSPTSMFPGENYPEMTNMTIKEVVELQKEKLRDGRESAAVGSYQFLYPETAAQRAGLSLDEKFTPENQLQMFAGTLLNKPGRENLSAFLQGIGGDIETAIDQLSQEFASIEYRDGRSYYNDGVNKASISRDQARAALLSVREELTTQ